MPPELGGAIAYGRLLLAAMSREVECIRADAFQHERQALFDANKDTIIRLQQCPPFGARLPLLIPAVQHYLEAFSPAVPWLRDYVDQVSAFAARWSLASAEWAVALIVKMHQNGSGLPSYAGELNMSVDLGGGQMPEVRILIDAPQYDLRLEFVWEGSEYIPVNGQRGLEQQHVRLVLKAACKRANPALTEPNLRELTKNIITPALREARRLFISECGFEPVFNQAGPGRTTLGATKATRSKLHPDAARPATWLAWRLISGGRMTYAQIAEREGLDLERPTGSATPAITSRNRQRSRILGAGEPAVTEQKCDQVYRLDP
jgi:hypothetical protein